MEFDEEKITRLSSEFMNSLRNLKDLSKLPEEDLISNSHYLGSAKYSLLVAIEAAIDMCNHLITKNRFRVPEGYTDTFKIMSEENIFDKEFTEKLIRMARFRNRLVHIYWDIDEEMIYKILQEDIQDLEKFIEEFMKSIK